MKAALVRLVHMIQHPWKPEPAPQCNHTQKVFVDGGLTVRCVVCQATFDLVERDEDTEKVRYG